MAANDSSVDSNSRLDEPARFDRQSAKEPRGLNSTPPYPYPGFNRTPTLRGPRGVLPCTTTISNRDEKSQFLKQKSFLLLVLKPQSGCQSFSNAVNTHALLFAHYVEIVFQKCCAMRVSNKVNCNQRSSKVNVKIVRRI